MRNWITENYMWVFSGIGVSAIGFLLKRIFGRNNTDNLQNENINNNTNTNTNNNSIVINNGIIPDSKDEVCNNPNKKNRDEVQILFIDDEIFQIVRILKKAGYKNTKRINDVTDLNCPDVRHSDIIFVDINGVGEELFPIDKGLGLAKALKDKYHEKYIVIYSAQENGYRFHEALKIVDNFLSKNSEPNEFVSIINEYLS